MRREGGNESRSLKRQRKSMAHCRYVTMYSTTALRAACGLLFICDGWMDGRTDGSDQRPSEVSRHEGRTDGRTDADGRGECTPLSLIRPNVFSERRGRHRAVAVQWLFIKGTTG